MTRPYAGYPTHRVWEIAKHTGELLKREKRGEVVLTARYRDELEQMHRDAIEEVKRRDRRGST